MIRVFVFLVAVLGAGVVWAERLPGNPGAVPEAPKGERSFRFVAMSDFNGSYGSVDYNEHVHALVGKVVSNLRPELAISAGDLVAGQKRGLTEEEVRAMWGGFDAAVAGPLKEAGILFAPAAGNHDASGYPAFAHEREIFREHWRKEERRPDLRFVDDTHYPLYYSFEYKGAFFMVLDVTTLEPLPEEMWRWMEEQLEAAQGFSLRFASCHVPPYPVTHGREKEIIRAPDNDRLRELFVRGNVDVFFTGHHHAYFKGRKEGLNLVSLNCAGNGPRPLIGTETPQRQSLVVVDVADGKIAEIFAVDSADAIFADETLPLRLEHGGYVLPRFDQE